MLGQLLQVGLLLGKLLLQLQELLLLALPDGVVLVRALALLEGVSIGAMVSELYHPPEARGIGTRWKSGIR